MKTYQHTQPGTLLRIILGFPAILLLASLSFVPSEVKTIFGGLTIILGLALILFHCLTVSIDANYLRLRIGVGLIQTKFQLSDITKAYPVKNKWYYGWGIRLLDKGLLYNVSGLDAVEILLTSGSIHRVGTDDPSALSQAINQSISGQRA